MEGTHSEEESGESGDDNESDDEKDDVPEGTTRSQRNLYFAFVTHYSSFELVLPAAHQATAMH